jgi:transcriptional regulator with XRE-family HTH domain
MSSAHYACQALAFGEAPRDDVGMNNVARIRKARGLSQEQLAEMVGVHQATISKLERGSESVTLELVFKVAAALNLPAASLFPHGEIEDRILAALSRVSPDRRAAALVVIEAMARD